ncbi:laccase [Rhyzopertha dominica]|nr:laccase [Rhyzopertha dominica]
MKKPCAAVVALLLATIHPSATDYIDNSTDILEYVLLDGKHPCQRTCTKNAPPMVCRYKFQVEWYQTMSKACYDCPYVGSDCELPHCVPGDGRKRPILVVNRQMPGPGIEVCVGDEIIVDVENRLPGDTTTMHWHGHHQRGTPYMDGVPFVTQCPILPGTTFRYTFRAVNAGTHFWHSHTGFQRSDGAYGAFIVRIPEESDPHCDLYDYDLSSHSLIILDWTATSGMEKFLAHHHSNGNNKPSSILVNGLGRYEKFVNGDNDTIYSPLARFYVQRGYRYRFRVINAGFLNCPIEISIDNHTITAISSDGNDFKPIKVESLVTYAGERFDFILNADQENGLYWMRFRGLMDCDERFNSVHQVAVLQYDGASSTDYPNENDVDYQHSHKEGLQLNPLNKGSHTNGTVTVTELNSLESPDVTLKEVPDFQYYVEYDFYKLDNAHYHVPGLYGFHNITDSKQKLLTPQLNHISMMMQPFPLLPARDLIKEGAFCNESTVSNCTKQHCECTHVVKIPLNAVVEMVLVDTGFAYDANHPFHLHGHAFRVIAMEKLGSNVTLEEVKRRDANKLIKRNLVDPPLKDTVTVPDGGFTILRFHASNPGYWLFHCHIEFHVEVGMGLIFKVGEHDQMPPVPDEFPKCGSYLPETHSTLPCHDSFILSTVSKLFPSLYKGDCNSAFRCNLNSSLVIFCIVLLLINRR